MNSGGGDTIQTRIVHEVGCHNSQIVFGILVLATDRYALPLRSVSVLHICAYPLSAFHSSPVLFSGALLGCKLVRMWRRLYSKGAKPESLKEHMTLPCTMQSCHLMKNCGRAPRLFIRHLCSFMVLSLVASWGDCGGCLAPRVPSFKELMALPCTMQSCCLTKNY